MRLLLVGLLLASNAFAVSRYECSGKLVYQGPRYDEAQIANLYFTPETGDSELAAIRFTYNHDAYRQHMRMQGNVVQCSSNQRGCFGSYLETEHDSLQFEIYPEDSRQDTLVHTMKHATHVYKGKLRCRLVNLN